MCLWAIPGAVVVEVLVALERCCLRPGSGVIALLRMTVVVAVDILLA